MLKRFCSYYKPHMKTFITDMVASFFIAIIGLCYPILTRTMLKTYVPEGNIEMILKLGLVLLGLYLIRMLLKYYVQYYGHVMGVKIQAQMRSEMFAHLERLPYAYYDEHETGQIMSRMTNDLQNVSELAHHGPENLFICGFLLIATFIYLGSINWYLTSIILLLVPVMAVISITLRKKMNEAYAKTHSALGYINGNISSAIEGIRVTKAFANADKEQDKFEENNGEFVAARGMAYKRMGQFGSSTAFVTDCFNIVVLIAGGIFMSQGTIEFADLSAFMVSVNMFITPLTTLINFVEQYEEGVTGFERFCKIMDEPEEVDAPDAISVDHLEGVIDFKDVNFSYEEGSAVLHDINLHIPKGEKLALVGQSGGGKTTICHLIPSFYKLKEGSITIDGIDIRKIKLDSLRRNIGIVQQDVFLFNGTIRDNILYGRLDASEEEVIEAAKKANIHDYIMEMKDGYDTIIGERGVKLSGGQKQRLSIARVFLKNPSILILDEATSALDNTTEILIQNALDELCKGRTTLIVAHRLSTIKNADEIVVINRGEIIEKGSHEALMDQRGIYANLYNLQFRNNKEMMDEAQLMLA